MRSPFSIYSACHLLLWLALVGFTRTAHAQMTGVIVEVDTAFYGPNTPTPDDTFDPEGLLDGYVSYLVYATFTNPTDVLSALYADVASFPGSSTMGINAPCGCWNPVSSSMVMDATNNSILWGFPATALYQYDTFWTIGMLSGNAPGSLPSFVSNPAVTGGAICGTQVTDGSVFTTGAPANAVAGDDLKIVIARVTTCGDWEISVNAQVFIEGDPSNNENFEIHTNGGPISVEDPCEDYAAFEANVNGLTTACAGLTTDVSMQFLGQDPALSTTYTLYGSTDNFASDTTLISQAASTQFPGLPAGNYVVHVVDEYGCMDTTAFDVVSPPAIEATISLVDDNACFGEADAVVELPDSMLFGGTGALTVGVMSPMGQPVMSTSGPDGLVWDGLVCANGEGAFVFTVSDQNGCTLVDTVTVNCPAEIEAEFQFGNVVCNGDADGFIVVEASGGSGELYITDQNETNLVADGLLDLSPGQYLVSVVDDFGCETEQVLFTITEPSEVTIEVVSTSPISCGNDCNGEVVVAFDGGMGDLTVGYFNLTTGATPPDSVSLCPGDHVATVVDSVGCSASVEFNIDAPAPLDFLIAPFNATCTGMSNGSADIFPIGGTVSDQEYDWFVLDTAGNVANLNNLSEMTYFAFVTDQIGCTYSETFDIGVDIVTDMEIATFTSPVTCWNAADGTATVSVNGGEAPFTFEWSDPFSQTTSTAVGLTEDTYTVTVTDALGCRRTASQTIEVIEGCLFIADALTPNDDGKNDEWIVGGLEDFPESVLNVYNRWGQLLFTTEGGAERWDGRFNGSRLPVADYYYTIELFPDALPIRGTVTLKY